MLQNHVRRKSNFLNPIKLIWVVQSPPKKYSAFRLPQITGITRAVPPCQRGVGHRHERWAGMRWTRQRRARDGIAGRVWPVSDHGARTTRQCPDNPAQTGSARRSLLAKTGGCVRQKRVVLTPHGWRQVSRRFCGPDRADKTIFRGATVTNKSGSPGRARHKPSDHCAGNVGLPPLNLYARVRLLFTFCTRDRGCSAHPAFPAPSFRAKACFQRPGRFASRGREGDVWLPSLRGAKRRSNPFFLFVARWIASLALAMTVIGCWRARIFSARHAGPCAGHPRLGRTQEGRRGWPGIGER